MARPCQEGGGAEGPVPAPGGQLVLLGWGAHSPRRLRYTT